MAESNLPLSLPRRLWVSPIDAFATLLRHPSVLLADRRTQARARRWLATAVLVCGLIVVSMMVFDVPAIEAQLPRGAPQLWLVRIYTEFAEPEYFLWPLGLATLIFVFAGAFAKTQVTRGVIAAIAVRAGFLFLAVALPNAMTEIIKDLIGRARPFVGGTANAFLFSPFAFDPRFESFPSSHAVTAFAVAFAIGSLWPRARFVLAFYAVGIAISRVVLLAHHPSDVLGGAAIGLIGAMLVRSWFARRRLAFFVGREGGVKSLPGPSVQRLKKVAGELFSQ